ncbi:MAG: MBOAT family O-acyltransferase [Candidatus Limivicinus sp.]|jgi:alginate O-acetyltransferase complex protein AlgI
MLFNSYIFLLEFLPLCLLGYFLLNRLGRKRLAMLFLFGMSLWFYGYNNPKYLILILASICINFLFYRLSGTIKNDKLRKAAMIMAVAVNLGILFYYKYFNFFVDTVNSVFRTDWNFRNIILPLGISFFTFQQISFVVDAFNGEVPDYRFLDYACFVTFFPQLIAGPIVTHDELVPQLMDGSRKRFNSENFVRGIYIFSMGLAKKVLIADALGRAVTQGQYYLINGCECMTVSTNCLVVMLAYTLQMYFDFSGYSDMAVGMGKMFNIDLPKNFDSPYKAVTILDHWKRWHLTLTRFLRKYIYIPLGGSRKGTARTYLNIMTVYFLSGLWHGAGWTYVVWGLLHGAFCVLTRWGKKFFDRIPKALNWFITFAFINLGFIIFRADSLSQAFEVIGNIFRFDFGPLDEMIASHFQIPELQVLLSPIPVLGRLAYNPAAVTAFFLTGAMLLVLLPKNAYEKMQAMKPSFLNLAGSVILIVWCIFSFGTVSTFLYFNF